MTREVHPEHETHAAPDAAMALARRTDALLALTSDKLFLVSPSGRAFLMYQVQGHSWIMMGDPVGDPDEWPVLLWRLRERADRSRAGAVRPEVVEAFRRFLG